MRSIGDIARAFLREKLESAPLHEETAREQDPRIGRAWEVLRDIRARMSRGATMRELPTVEAK